MMDSPQSVVSPFKGCSTFAEPEKHSTVRLSRSVEVQSKETSLHALETLPGVLDVSLHQARDIHNICIYHKQDVYAKLCLTSDPKNVVSTKIIHGGGENPVFNENHHFNVHTTDSSLKCEIWMMSRVRNYLEDQLLGFVLVPLSEVLVNNGKLEKEFSLSSTDLFHSPAGFVQLSLSYNEASPEVIAIPTTTSMTTGKTTNLQVSESLSCEFDKIEFPDPKIVNENQVMVSEYLGIHSDLESLCCGELASSNTDSHLKSEAGNGVVESFSTGTVDSVQSLKHDSPHSSVSTVGSPSIQLPASSQSSETSMAAKYISSPKEKCGKVGDAGSNVSSGGLPNIVAGKPAVNVNVKPEQNVVQQEIVDMYLKSMQQFTESLSKMKLPLDFENETTASSESSTSDQKPQAPKTNSSRVFYGSRAFF